MKTLLIVLCLAGIAHADGKKAMNREDVLMLQNIQLQRQLLAVQERDVLAKYNTDARHFGGLDNAGNVVIVSDQPPTPPPKAKK